MKKPNADCRNKPLYCAIASQRYRTTMAPSKLFNNTGAIILDNRGIPQQEASYHKIIFASKEIGSCATNQNHIITGNVAFRKWFSQ